MIDHFMTRRNIKDFLLLHNEKKWKKIITYTLEIGIEFLKKQQNIVRMTEEDIENFLFELKEPVRGRNKTKVQAFQIKNKPSSEWRTGMSKSRSASKESGIEYTSQDYLSYVNSCTNPFIENQQYQYSNEVNSEDPVYHDNINHYNENTIRDNYKSVENDNSALKYHRENAHPHIPSVPVNMNQTRQNHRIPQIQNQNKSNYQIKRSKTTDFINIYPDWWGNTNDQDFRFTSDNSFERKKEIRRSAQKKKYNEVLSLDEKRNILKKSREHTPSLGGGRIISRERQAYNEYARNRINDKLFKPDIPSKIKDDVCRDKNYYLRNVANSSTQHPRGNVSQPQQSTEMNVHYSTSPVQSSEIPSRTIQNDNIRQPRENNINTSNQNNNEIGRRTVETNYMISYDKNLRPQQVQERSVERYSRTENQSNINNRNAIPSLRNNLNTSTHNTYHRDNKHQINRRQSEQNKNMAQISQEIPQSLDNTNQYTMPRFAQTQIPQREITLNPQITQMNQNQASSEFYSQINNQNDQNSIIREEKKSSVDKKSKLNESACSLSSFTPSERTKEFYQREIFKNKNLADRQSHQSQNYQNTDPTYNYNMIESINSQSKDN